MQKTNNVRLTTVVDARNPCLTTTVRNPNPSFETSPSSTSLNLRGYPSAELYQARTLRKGARRIWKSARAAAGEGAVRRWKRRGGRRDGTGVWMEVRGYRFGRGSGGGLSWLVSWRSWRLSFLLRLWFRRRNMRMVVAMGLVRLGIRVGMIRRRIRIWIVLVEVAFRYVSVFSY